jgi:hypothetical protein
LENEIVNGLSVDLSNEYLIIQQNWIGGMARRVKAHDASNVAGFSETDVNTRESGVLTDRISRTPTGTRTLVEQ